MCGTGKLSIAYVNSVKQRSLTLTIVFSSIAVLLLIIVLASWDNIVMSARYASLINKPPDAKIAIPIRGIRPQQIADTWGAARGSDRKHEGQDIFARKGTPVYSATEGYVIEVGENPLGGRTVSVLGAGGRVYYYAHLHAYGDVVKGQLVSPDTVLGFVGNTGNAATTPPHLHFGVYSTTGAINPLTLF
jgi:murein DD-endopeptidase MepM/ murein hydrolase activator NlpD